MNLIVDPKTQHLTITITIIIFNKEKTTILVHEYFFPFQIHSYKFNCVQLCHLMLKFNSF